MEYFTTFLLVVDIVAGGFTRGWWRSDAAALFGSSASDKGSGGKLTTLECHAL